MGEAVGMRSRYSVHYQLVELETKQAIVREPGRARGIRLALPARAATTCCSRRLSGRCGTDGGGVRTWPAGSSATGSVPAHLHRHRLPARQHPRLRSVETFTGLDSVWGCPCGPRRPFSARGVADAASRCVVTVRPVCAGHGVARPAGASPCRPGL
ncbi:hypothetical protein [Streptomyces sp. NPDC004008]